MKMTTNNEEERDGSGRERDSAAQCYKVGKLLAVSGELCIVRSGLFGSSYSCCANYCCGRVNTVALSMQIITHSMRGSNSFINRQWSMNHQAFWVVQVNKRLRAVIAESH